jgi:quercetin dioxygenase-like cupin family protein
MGAMSLPYLATAADHQQLEWIGGGVMNVLFDAATTDGQLTVLRSRLPKGAAAPVHVHSAEDEMFVLLKGDGIFWAGDQRYELSDGGVVFLPRNLPHAYRFTSDEVDLLTLCVPSGIEGFFRSAGWDLAEPKPEGWQLSPASMAAAAAAFGQRIIGPPLDAQDQMPTAYLESA